MRERKATIAIFLFSIIILLLGLADWLDAQENSPIICYRGVSQIGTVTVFDWRAAASTCNTVLHDCKGACFGCFRDSNFIDEVCVGMNGRAELKWDVMRKAKEMTDGVAIEIGSPELRE